MLQMMIIKKHINSNIFIPYPILISLEKENQNYSLYCFLFLFYFIFYALNSRGSMLFFCFFFPQYLDKQDNIIAFLLQIHLYSIYQHRAVTRYVSAIHLHVTYS